MKEPDKFSILDDCRKYILDNLDSVYYFQKYEYNYNAIITKLTIDFSIKYKFSLNSIVDERGDIISVLLVGDGVNTKFVFNKKKWIRKNKIDNLL